MVVLVSLNNLLPGRYRVVIHERGNCSSPNAFSAGRPWAPPGDPRRATELLPVMAIGANGARPDDARLSRREAHRPDSLAGRSVLVHAGDDAPRRTLVPDVPNGVVLCGALGPIRSFMEIFN